MPIADFLPRKETILFPGGSFEVRAVTIQDIAALVDIHQDAIDEIYIRIQSRADEEFTPEIAQWLMMNTIQQSPILAAHLIALAADEPREMMNVMKMPLTIQVEALQRIGELTFTDIASAKKFGGDVMNLMRVLLPSPMNQSTLADMSISEAGANGLTEGFES